jgi:hypothetical protein
MNVFYRHKKFPEMGDSVQGHAGIRLRRLPVGTPFLSHSATTAGIQIIPAHD